MKKIVSNVLILSVLFACGNKSELIHEDLPKIAESETKKEISKEVSGEDLLRYFSKNINCSHNHTVLVLLNDSVRVIGKNTDVTMSVTNKDVGSVFWKTHDWLKAQPVSHDGEEKYYVTMADLLPDDTEVKKHFPNDYHILKHTKSSDGLKIARNRLDNDFYYAANDGVYFLELDKKTFYSKSEFKDVLDSLRLKN